MNTIENWNIENRLQWNEPTQGSTKEELVNALKEEQEKQWISPEEYLKDLEATWYPQAIQEARKEWHPVAILEVLRDAWVNLTSSKVKLLWFLPEDKHFELWELAHNHFWTSDFLADYSWEWAQECSDGSDLLTIVKWNWKYYIAKLACWEFNRKTFTEGVKRMPKLKLHKSDIPLFVVNQSDSYFATQWTLQADIRNVDVRMYLDLYAKLASLKTWEAEKRSYFMEEKVPFDWSQIKIPEYEELKKILETKLE